MAPLSAYRQIILPQALRPILPALGNYLVAMLKDTPVLSAMVPRSYSARSIVSRSTVAVTGATRTATKLQKPKSALADAACEAD